MKYVVLFQQYERIYLLRFLNFSRSPGPSSDSSSPTGSMIASSNIDMVFADQVGALYAIPNCSSNLHRINTM
jgi:hypothetical protein